MTETTSIGSLQYFLGLLFDTAGKFCLLFLVLFYIVDKETPRHEHSLGMFTHPRVWETVSSSTSE